MEAGQDGSLVVFCWWVGVSIVEAGGSGGLLEFCWWDGASNMKEDKKAASWFSIGGLRRQS